MKGRPEFLAMLCLSSACSAHHDGQGSAAAPSRHRTTPVQARASAQDDKDRTIVTPAHTGAWYRAGAYRVRSLVPGLVILPAGDLPVIPYEGDRDGFCGTAYATPKTAEGKWARSRGWRVGQELRLGQLTIVNVMRRYHYETQACGQIGGRVVVFRGGRPVAAISLSLPDVNDSLAIDTFEMLGSGGVRLANPWIAPPGDLFSAGQDIEIRAVPPLDRVCGGMRIVPNVFGKPIRQARTALRKAGWMPVRVRQPRPERDVDGNWYYTDSTARDQYKKGIVEVTGCAPTGFCGYDYRSRGAKLAVTTQGDGVVGYEIRCGG